MLELVAVALERAQAGGVLILVGQLAHAPFVLAAQSGEAALPATQALDHIGLDQQLLPPPRRAQGAGHHAIAVALGCGGRLVDGRRVFDSLGRRHEPLDLFGRRRFCGSKRCDGDSPRYK